MYLIGFDKQEMRSRIARCVDGPSEVGNLQFALGADEEIFWLDVPVDHVLAVAVDQCVRDFVHELQIENFLLFFVNFCGLKMM